MRILINKPQLITDDKRLIQAIQVHPAIVWATKKPKIGNKRTKFLK